MARESKRKREEKRFGRPERLADLVLTDAVKWVIPEWCEWMRKDEEAVRSLGSARRDFVQELRGATIVSAENVGEYFYAENPQETWNYERDFPSCAPPLRSLFLEFKRPYRLLSEGRVLPAAHMPEQWGWLLTSVDAAEVLAESRDDSKRREILENLKTQLDQLATLIDMNVLREALQADNVDDAMNRLGDRERTFVTLGAQYKHMAAGGDATPGIPEGGKWCVGGSLVITHGERLTPLGTCSFWVSAAGQIIQWPIFGVLGGGSVDATAQAQIRDTCSSMLFPAVLALSFMNCKNVTLQPVEPNQAINRERQRHGRPPFVRYHVINIEPMKKVLRAEGQAETQGLKRALHICRGHFATYTPERPLFGRKAGTFWIPAHVRGSSSRGVVVSDYSVNPPQEPPSRPDGATEPEK